MDLRRIRFHNFDGFTGWERIFITIVIRRIKEKDYDFFNSDKCTKLARFLAVTPTISWAIKKRIKIDLTKHYSM